MIIVTLSGLATVFVNVTGSSHPCGRKRVRPEAENGRVFPAISGMADTLQPGQTWHRRIRIGNRERRLPCGERTRLPDKDLLLREPGYPQGSILA